MHLHVRPDLTIQHAHSLAGKVKSILKSRIPTLTGVLIHVEPEVDGDAAAVTAATSGNTARGTQTAPDLTSE